jgi:integrase
MSAPPHRKGGRHPKLEPTWTPEWRDGQMVGWRIRLPRFGPDGRPRGGGEREVIRRPAWLTEPQVRDEARRLFLDRMRGIGGPGPQAPQQPLLIATLLRYHHEVSLGPTRPRRPATLRAELRAIRDAAAWLIDRAHGFESAPRPPRIIMPRSITTAAAVGALDIPLTDFDTAALRRLTDYLARRTGVGGVNLTLCRLRVVLRWAVESGLIDRQPIGRRSLLSLHTQTIGGKTPPPADRKRHYTLEEVARLDAALDGDARRWARVHYLTGARPGELIQLQARDIDRAGGMLRIPAGKTGERRILLFPALTAELEGFERWPHVRTSDPAAWYCRCIGAARTALGISAVKPLHAYRHALITALGAVGAALQDRARWCGHSLGGESLVTHGYDHAHLESLRRIAALIPVPWQS